MLSIQKLWKTSLLLVGVTLFGVVCYSLIFTTVTSLPVNEIDNLKSPLNLEQTLAPKERSKVEIYPLGFGNASSEVAWLDEQVRYFFDHKLYHYAESSQHVWRIFEQACLPLLHCDELRALFVRYIQYKAALKTIKLAQTSTFDLGNTLAGIDALQEQFFNEYEINALFYTERITQQQALERKTILTASDINNDVKQALLMAHLSSLPEAQRRVFSPTVSLTKVITLFKSDTLNDEHYTQLTDQFGDAAAQRLLNVRQKQADWQRRINSFNQKVNQIKILFEHDLHTQQLEIADLKNQSFTVQEQKRII